ncbi:MAG: hypothetical protein FD174_2184 [Geobacteraceae bacterium]|nr:MAG: hypothetical protein FD174_2184 [Geobacteraceae bacterium]
MVREISGAFTGGALGALVDSFNIWILGKAGVTAMLGIGLKPEFTPAWLYPRLVWGGIWMLLLMLPVLKKREILRGCAFSLIPSAMMLFMVFPEMGKGMLGLGFGVLTPLLVILLNFIYGIVASLWYREAAR